MPIFKNWDSPRQNTVQVRGMNPLFLVLAVLSGIPTAFVFLMYVTGAQTTIEAILFLWCAMWTWVWYKMADRYR